MKILFILLRGGQSLEESVVMGLISGLFFSIVIAIYNWIKSSNQRRKKKWDEVSKKETDQMNKSDWD